jgi:hypothetical protein
MKLTNRFNLPETLVNTVGIAYAPKENRIGVTELIDSPLIRQLKLQHWDILEEDVSDKLWSVLGSACHYILEKGAPINAFGEEKLTFSIGNKTIAGKSDLYHDEEISDWKVTSVWNFLLGAKDEWIAQLNVYKFLWEKMGYPVKSLKINAILRDWQKSKAKFDNTYPQIPFLSIDIPMWSTPIVTEYIFDRLAYHAIKPAPECTPEEKWQRESSFAVIKGDNKRATRVFDTEAEAQEYAKSDSKYHVESRPGECVRCQDYCIVKNVCPYHK